MRTTLALTLVLAAGLLPSVSRAGVVMEMDVTLADAPDKSGTETFRAQGEMTRTDVAAPDGQGQSVIFRDQTMTFLDHRKKTAQQIGRKDVEQIAAQLDDLMKQLEGMPPQQREMMQKMMKGKMPGAGKPPEQRVEVGGTEQVAGFACTLRTLYSDGKKSQEVCVADAEAARDLHEAMGAFMALAEFSESLMKVAEGMPFADSIRASAVELYEEGFPIRQRFYDDEGKLVRESTLRSIEKQEIDPAVFAVPKGYKVNSLQKELQRKR